MKKLLLAVSLCSLVLFACAAPASASTLTLRSLAQTVAALKKQVNTQARTIKSLKNQLVAGKPVLALAPYVSLKTGTLNGVAGPNLVFQGVNLHVRSNSNEDDTSGRGNLIVGWDNDPPSPLTGYRSGSNNLVCGDQNSFLNNGSLLAGLDNTCREEYASVSGGYNNTARGLYASVSGGYDNTASGLGASVSGGAINYATLNLASVSGGYFNTASGLEASVSGGRYNTASGTCASISGGGGDTVPIGLTVGANYGWAAGNAATPGTGTAKFVAP
jgi:trimeric autotransporter adhesin